MGEVNELLAQKSAAQINSTVQEAPIRITTGEDAPSSTVTTTISPGNSTSGTHSHALSLTTATTTPIQQQQNGDLLQNGENKVDDSTTQMDVDEEEDSQTSSAKTEIISGNEMSKLDKMETSDIVVAAAAAASNQNKNALFSVNSNKVNLNNSKKDLEIEGTPSINSDRSHDKITDDSVSQELTSMLNPIDATDDEEDQEHENEKDYNKNMDNGSITVESQDDDSTEGDQDSQDTASSKYLDGDEQEFDKKRTKIITATSGNISQELPVTKDPLKDHSITSTENNNKKEQKLNGEASEKEKILNDDTGIVSLDDSDEDMITEVEGKSTNVSQSSELLSSTKIEDSFSSNSKVSETFLPKITQVTTISDTDDGAVVIGSDSENEDSYTASNQKQQQGEQPQMSSPAKKPMSIAYNQDEDDDDDDDCVVIEDDTPIPQPNSADSKRKMPVKSRDFISFGTGNDILSVDDSQPPSKRQRISAPLSNAGGNSGITQSQALGQITIKDARTLMPQQQQQQQQQQQSLLNLPHNCASNKEAPSLVIFDARSAEANCQPSIVPNNPAALYPVIIRPSNNASSGGLNSNVTGTAAVGMHSPPAIGPPKLVPVSGLPLSALQQQNITANSVPVLPTMLSNTNLLPGLTDDMFVLEAPSFIVPYIYEKPPTDNLREIVNEIETKFELKRDEVDDDQNDDLVMITEQNKNVNSSATVDNNTKKKKKKRSVMDDVDDSWSESDEDDDDDDDDDSDVEVRTKVLIQEATDDLKTLKAVIKPTSSIVPSSSASLASGIGDGGSMTNISVHHATMKGENFFESPLGKFFMDIGVGLVQEFVQSDLLRLQKRKLRRSMGKNICDIERAVTALSGNLEASKKRNLPFKFTVKRCEFCNFKSESALAMANHYESPHMNGVMYRCNFCPYEIRSANDIIYHMEAMHNIKARLVKQLPYHQCPNCGFEDNGKAKLARHQPVCAKKFRPEYNLAPPMDWEAPAKIPRIKPRHGLVGTATAYQAMAAQAAAQKAALASIQQQQQQQVQQARTMQAAALAAQNAANNAKIVNRGRTQTLTKPVTNNAGVIGTAGTMLRAPSQIRPTGITTGILPNNYQFTGTQLIQITGSGLAILPNAHNNALTLQTATAAAMNKNKASTTTGQPSISITPLPRQNSNAQAQQQQQQQEQQQQQQQQQQAHIQSSQSSASMMPSKMQQAGIKPGQNTSTAGGNKAQFVICEICDGYIKDLEQLRNHMQWMHKVKIHPKMIYNRPPLNCQKCQFRFFTDQGLERHLLGSHGLVTSSMQEAANKGKDAGRCPVCGRMYQWKLLNHVSRDHHMTLKPAHLSYKCTVCTATFGMYKQFETHVYTAHSTVAKKAMDGKGKSNNSGNSGSNNSSSSSHARLSTTNDSLLKPLKINDEITIIPQPSNKSRLSNMESHVID